MLARNAEVLFWIGRYVERADDTARILDVAVHQLLEDSTVDPDEDSRVLLRVLGIEPPETKLDMWSLTDIVAFQRGLPAGCSIVDAITAARENARSAREVISSDMWECLNTTYNRLGERERAARRLGPHEFLSFIEGRAAMFAGLTGSMGTSAWVKIEGVSVVVVCSREQPFDQAFARSLGIDCAKMRYICVKSAAHFRAAFEPIAGSIYNVDAAGIHTHDFSKIPHTKRTRRIFPVEIPPGS